MKKLNKSHKIEVEDFIYVPASGFILEVTNNEIKAGRFTSVTTANIMLQNGVKIFRLL